MKRLTFQGQAQTKNAILWFCHIFGFWIVLFQFHGNAYIRRHRKNIDLYEERVMFLNDCRFRVLQSYVLCQSYDF